MKTTIEEITKILAEIGIIYGRDVTDLEYTIFYKNLMNYDINELSKSFSDYMADEKKGSFFPKVHEIIKNLEFNRVRVIQQKTELVLKLFNETLLHNSSGLSQYKSDKLLGFNPEPFKPRLNIECGIGIGSNEIIELGGYTGLLEIFKTASNGNIFKNKVFEKIKEVSGVKLLSKSQVKYLEN